MGETTVLTGGEIPLPQFPAGTATAGAGSGMTTPRRQLRQIGEPDGERATLAATQRCASSSLQQMQQPFVSRRVYEERVYVQPKTFVEEQIVEVPRIEYRDRVVETPQTVYLEKVRAVPRVQVQHRIIHVPKPVTKEVTVEVPHIQWQEKVVEIPTPIYQEKVVPVPKPVVQEQVVYVPRPVIEEKTVEVPRVVYRPLPIEKVVEVPEYRYVYKDEPAPAQQVLMVPPSCPPPPVFLPPPRVVRDTSSTTRRQKTCCFGLLRYNEDDDTSMGRRGVRTPETPRAPSRGRGHVSRSRMRLKTAPTLQPIKLNLAVKKAQPHQPRGGSSSSRGRESRSSPFLSLFECCSFPFTSVDSPRTPSTRSSSASPRVRYVYYPLGGEKVGSAAVPAAGRATVPVCTTTTTTPRYHTRPAAAAEQQTARVRYASAPPPPSYYYGPGAVTGGGGRAAAASPAAAAAPLSPRGGDVNWDVSGAGVAQLFADYAEQHLPAPEPLIQTRLGIMRFAEFEALNNTNALYASPPPPHVMGSERLGQQLLLQQRAAKKAEEKDSPTAATSRSPEWSSLRSGQPETKGAAAAPAERQQAAAGSEESGVHDGNTNSEGTGTTSEPSRGMDPDQQRDMGEAAAELEGGEEQQSVSGGGAEGGLKPTGSGKKTIGKAVAAPVGSSQQFLPYMLQQQPREVTVVQQWRWEQDKIAQERQRLQDAAKIREQQIARLQQQQRQVQQQLLEQQRAFEAEQRELQDEQQRLRETIRRHQYETLAASLQCAPVPAQQFLAGTRGRSVMPGAFATFRAWPFPVYNPPSPRGLAEVDNRVEAAAPAQPAPAIPLRYARPAAETGPRAVYAPAAFLPSAIPSAPPPPLRPAVVALSVPAAAAVTSPRAPVALPVAAAAMQPFPGAVATPQPAGLYRMYVVPHLGHPLSSSASGRAAAAAARNSTAVSGKPVPLIPIDVSALRAVPADPDDLVDPAAPGSAEAAVGGTEQHEIAAGDLSPDAYRREVARQAQEAVQSAYLAGVYVYRSVRDVVRKEIDAALAQDVE